MLVIAPTDAVITDVTSTQPGDKIEANAPLGGIGPKYARPILKIEIAEHDRAFRLIRSTLQSTSPATKPSLQTK